MKKVIPLAFLVFFAWAFVSCKKSTLKDADAPPKIVAQISRHITQPVDTQLGDSTFFEVGSKLVIYVPYDMQNEDIDTAYIVITDQQNQAVASTELVESFDYNEDGIKVPDELQHKQFLYAAIYIEDFFADKKFNISIHVQGEHTSSSDKLESAFSVHFPPPPPPDPPH